MKKSCTLLPSGIWIFCILFVSLNFFLFPHGMWVIFFFVCASVGLWMTWEQVLISAGYSTSRKTWAVKQGHASKGLWGIWHLPATLETTRWSLASLARSHASPLETRKFRCSCPNTSEMLFAGYGCGSRNESVTKADDRMRDWKADRSTRMSHMNSLLSLRIRFFLQWSIQKTT